MLITVQALQKQGVAFDEQFRPGTLDLGEEVTQQGPAHVRGQAELVEEHAESHRVIHDIRLRGDYSVRVAVQCARCLEPVERQLKESFDLLYRPLGAVPRPPESAISRDETEIGFYQGEGLQLEQAIGEQILLAVPLRMLCRPNCKGLCPRCGKNLNVEQCQCPPTPQDERWSALGELREKIDH
jgi:uncharacterized protein